MAFSILRAYAFMRFAGLELGRDAIPDETTILNFRHLLERHDLTKAIFESVAEHLAAKGELLRGGTIVDATLIAASPSTKNKEQKHDPAMSSSKEGNQWYFGMKAHIGVDAESGLVHTAGVTTGKVNDAKVMANLIREDDTAEKAGVRWRVKEKAKPGRDLTKRQRARNSSAKCARRSSTCFVFSNASLDIARCAIAASPRTARRCLRCSRSPTSILSAADLRLLEGECLSEALHNSSKMPF
jgi:IS5 family transposase